MSNGVPGARKGFDIDLAFGHEAEDYVRDVRHALATQRIEVKRDDLALRTGNIFIEYADNPGGAGWKPSGIKTTIALVYVFVIGSAAIVVPTQALHDLYDQLHGQPGYDRLNKFGSCPTWGLCVSVNQLVEAARGYPLPDLKSA